MIRKIRKYLTLIKCFNLVYALLLIKMMENKIVKRKIIKIDEEKCDGCGRCVNNCPEGAIRIINGKARLINEPNCDGLGTCIGDCPLGAITIEERNASPYDEISVLKEAIKSGNPDVLLKHLEHLRKHSEFGYLKQAQEFLAEIKHPLATKCDFELRKPQSKCLGAESISFKPVTQFVSEGEEPSNQSIESQLRHWPIQLHLINPGAAHYCNSDLLVVADCVPFAMATFHNDYLKGRTLVIACPKLDHGQEVYLEKLVCLIDEASVETITVMIMEVPCCFKLLQIVQRARRRAVRRIRTKIVLVSIRGSVIKEEWIEEG